MRVLVVGKRHSIVNWMENIVANLQKYPCEVAKFAVNGKSFWDSGKRKLAKLGGKHLYHAHLAKELGRTLDRFDPEIVIFVQAFWFPQELFKLVKVKLPECRTAGLIGDRPKPEDRDKSDILDRVYFTDSGFLHDAENWNYRKNYEYMPHAVDPDKFKPASRSSSITKQPEMLFIGNPTPYRVQLINEINHPVTLYGKNWKKYRINPRHKVYSQRISIQETAKLYADFEVVLNLKNETNVISGLNQRSFEPMACKAVVLNDFLPDINLCFEPEKEILVYHNATELNALFTQLCQEENYRNNIAEAGYARVMAEHTYRHRLDRIFSDLKKS